MRRGGIFRRGIKRNQSVRGPMKKFYLLCIGVICLAGCYSSPSARPSYGAESGLHREAPVSTDASVRLSSAQNPRTAAVTSVSLSLDGARAAVRMPGKRAVMLERSFTPRGPRWTKPGAPLVLERLPEGWRLFENGVLVYWACNPKEGVK